MERINIDGDFQDWIIGNMKLRSLMRLYERYLQERPKIVVIKSEDLSLADLPEVVFESELEELKKDLDKIQ